MQYTLLIRLIGFVLVGEAALMLPSLGVAVLYNEGDTLPFLLSIGLLLAIGAPCIGFTRTGLKNRNINAREGLALVAVSWVLLSFFGALPFVFSGDIPNLVDAFFETTSGFTTTGASILTDVEALPHGMLFWRSFTHWVGGMGVLVLTLALLPRVGNKTLNILRAESPGPSTNKLMPKMRQFARMLYAIYFAMTVLLIVLLLIARMPLFDSVVHAFGAAGTGGFGIKNQSIGFYQSAAVDYILGIAMLLFGVNFSVYFALLSRNFRTAFKNTELYLYGLIVGASVLVITINILPEHGTILRALRYAFFQVSSIITTTGYATDDFKNWPQLSRCILLTLMVVGACAGSTGGGIKVVRLLLLLKAGKNEMKRMLHPRSVLHVKMDGRTVDDEVLRGVMMFFFLYMAIGVFALLAVSLDNHDLDTTLTAVVATLGNIGPGLGLVSPSGNYSIFSPLSKIVLSMCMLVGRLEIMPILMMFSPSLWKRA